MKTLPSSSAYALYDMLSTSVSDSDEIAEEIFLGLTWTLCRSKNQLGLAMSPGLPCRTLPWPGTLRGQSLKKLSEWLISWNLFEASVALAASNSIINNTGNRLFDAALPLSVSSKNLANLAVFEHFKPQLIGQRVVIVGRYPGLMQCCAGLTVTVLERLPADNDLPDSAAEFVIPQADWVFITASALINKTLPRLLELARHAVTVLMGPSLPWLEEWAEFHVDYLAGVRVLDAERCKHIVAEGGGMCLFGEGVQYALLGLGRYKF